MATKDLNEVRRNLHHSQADLNYSLEVFGDAIAKREGYRDLDGLEAVHFYLMQKHHWLPSQVRAMTHEDLRFALTVEMQGWTLPADAMPRAGR